MHANVTSEDQPVGQKPCLLLRLLSWKVAIPALLFALLMFAPVIYRQRQLSQVPNIDDPFPASMLLKPIPTEQNAFPLFEEAFALHVEVAEVDFEKYMDEELDGWDPAHHHLNKYLELNRPALEKWREATEKENYQVVPVDQLSLDFYVTNIQANRALVRWCQVEIERLTKTGKPADTLPWLRASFRCSGLVTRNAPWLDRLVGAAVFAISTTSAENWMQQPDVTREQLLDLLSVVQISARMMETPSTTVKVNYLVDQHEYATWSYDKMEAAYARMGATPPLGSKWETWLFAEPEVSRRLAAHAAANHLDFVDDHRRDRPPFLDGDVFDESAAGVTPSDRLPAHRLTLLLKNSKLIGAENQDLIASPLDAVDREQARYACLQVALSAQAFHRTHGEFPERLADLLPQYLSSLPDDPYAPKPTPVIYRRTGDDAVVYSRYTNGVDDGAATVTFDEAVGGGMGPTDFGIRIRTPRNPTEAATRR